MRLLWKGIKGCWYFFWGHIFAIFLYDKKYLRGRWFAGKMCGLCSPGWKWVVQDAIWQLLLQENSDARYPVSRRCQVLCPENIEFDPNDLNNFQSFGIYYQAIGKIHIGGGTFVGPNAGLITSNHDFSDLDNHYPAKDIYLGEKCWIGMNSVILPGVRLGNNTIVGAGSVVTKSFEEGNCIIAGNPAKIIKRIGNKSSGKMSRHQ